jgi:hypothetical protein
MTTSTLIKDKAFYFVSMYRNTDILVPLINELDLSKHIKDLPLFERLLSKMRYNSGDILFDKGTEETYVVHSLTVFGVNDTFPEISYMLFNLNTMSFVEIIEDYIHKNCRHVESTPTRNKRYELLKKNLLPLLTINIY